jgi:hypothetical protein
MAEGQVRCFTHTAQLSLGNLANDIPMVGEGAQRLADAIAATLYVEDRENHWQRLAAYDEPELRGGRVAGFGGLGSATWRVSLSGLQSWRSSSAL